MVFLCGNVVLVFRRLGTTIRTAASINKPIPIGAIIGSFRKWRVATIPERLEEDWLIVRTLDGFFTNPIVVRTLPKTTASLT
jgi:hypothetical protein